MLLGAVVASTDSAAVFSVLRSVRLPRRVVGMLEAESGFNDAPAVLAVVALTASATGTSEEPWWVAVLLAGAALLVGLVVGVAVGWLGSLVLARLASPVSGPVPARGDRRGRHRLRRRPPAARQRVPRRLRRRPGPGQPRACPTAPPPAGSPPRWAGWRRSGCSCCSACSSPPPACPASCCPPWR